MSNIAEKIKGAKDIREQIIEVPEWGVSLLIVEPTMSETEGWRKRHTKSRLVKGALVQEIDSMTVAWDMFYHVLRDPETRESIFDSPRHVEEVLSNKSSTVMAKLLLACKDFMETEISDSEVEQAVGE